VPTVREPDGLALSSRNRFLSAKERQTAPALHAAMRGTKALLTSGARVTAALAEGVAGLQKSGLAPDYYALVHASTLTPLKTLDAPARLIAAAKLGRIRLLDNIAVV
jgi:pantoate--beta-alanine ligase